MNTLYKIAIIQVFFIACQCGSFWHITDTHMDWLYKVNSTPIDTLCRSGSGNAGPFGDYSCYPPIWLQESAIKTMHDIEPNPQFILHGGDTYPHEGGAQSDYANSILNSTITLRKYFPNVPILYTLGNHDCYPSFCVAPEGDWLKVVSNTLSDFMTSDQQTTFQEGGYYVSEIDGYRIIVVNTNLYNSMNNFTANITGDIGYQFQFIRDELETAFSKNQKVLIHGHIPPGFTEQGAGGEFFRNQEQNDNYLKTFENFGEIIMGHLYGHTHTDSFRLSKNSGTMFLHPSVCEMGRNPAMARLYQYDDDSKQLLSYSQYWANLSLANEQNQINWELEYATNQEPYNLPDLSLDTMTQFLQKLQSNSTLFDYYYAFNMAMYPQNPCLDSCQKVQFCAIENTYYQEFQQCLAEKDTKVQNQIE